MIATRVCAALSVVLGSFVILFLLLMPCFYSFNNEGNKTTTTRTRTSTPSSFDKHNDKKNPRWIYCFKWTSILISVTLAVFSAVIPPLMVNSNLCENSYLLDTVDQNLILWERCDKSTPAYYATFFNLVAWLMIAVLIQRVVKFPTISTPLPSARTTNNNNVKDSSTDNKEAPEGQLHV